jgi:hypothetical protein
MIMNYNDLSNLWNSADQSLENTIRINQLLLKERSFKKLHSELFEVKWTAYFEGVVGLLFMYFLIGFIEAHLQEIQFLVPACILYIVSLAAVIFEIVKLINYYRIKSSDTIQDAQRRVSLLQKMEVYDTYSLMFIIPAFGLPFMIVVAKALAGINLYALGTSWMFYFLGVNLLVALVLVIILRRFPNKKLAEAQEFLRDLKENDAE